MNPNIQAAAALVGRILLAIIFIKSGFGKITGFEGTAAYMASKGLPMVQLLLIGTIVIELLGGIMLVVGYKARWAALAIFLWLIPTTFIFHAFWGIADAKEAGMQQIQFLKNITIMGGMLMVYAFGPGRYAVNKS
jgi:putative oxidoreductase